MKRTAGWLIVVVSALALVSIALLLDVQREFEDALGSLEQEQRTLATAVAADFETRLHRWEESEPSPPGDARAPISKLFGGALKLEQRGSRILVVQRPDHDEFVTTDGRVVASPELSAALRARRTSLRLSRDEAPHFGFPARIALAGMDTVRGRDGRWGVAVLASAERLRERERYAQLRFLISLGLVTAIVAGFGGLALWQRQREREVARELRVAALERERERLLAKADKMATLAALSSGIAHEVATPLSTIMARAEQLVPIHADDPRASAALKVVLAQVERIQAVIRGMLALARGELPRLVPAAAREIAQSAVSLSMHRFEQAGVAIELELQPTLPPLACDPPMLEQALTNLLLNACDASPRGSIVRLSVRAEERQLVFAVEDEGEGIPPETAARTEEPFFTTKPRGRGNGLGLAITREVVAHHGGKLHLAARIGARGTQARIEVPHA